MKRPAPGTLAPLVPSAADVKSLPPSPGTDWRPPPLSPTTSSFLRQSCMAVVRGYMRVEVPPDSFLSIACSPKTKAPAATALADISDRPEHLDNGGSRKRWRHAEQTPSYALGPAGNYMPRHAGPSSKPDALRSTSVHAPAQKPHSILSASQASGASAELSRWRAENAGAVRPPEDRPPSRSGRVLKSLRSWSSSETLRSSLSRSNSTTAGSLDSPWRRAGSILQRKSDDSSRSGSVAQQDSPAAHEVDLNRPLPPLPSLSTWDATIRAKAECLTDQKADAVCSEQAAPLPLPPRVSSRRQPPSNSDNGRRSHKTGRPPRAAESPTKPTTTTTAEPRPSTADAAARSAKAGSHPASVSFSRASPSRSSSEPSNRVVECESCGSVVPPTATKTTTITSSTSVKEALPTQSKPRTATKLPPTTSATTTTSETRGQKLKRQLSRIGLLSTSFRSHAPSTAPSRQVPLPPPMPMEHELRQPANGCPGIFSYRYPYGVATTITSGAASAATTTTGTTIEAR